MAAAEVLAFASRETYCWPPTQHSTSTTSLEEAGTYSYDDALLNLRLGLIADAWISLHNASVSSCCYVKSSFNATVFLVTIIRARPENVFQIANQRPLNVATIWLAPRYWLHYMHIAGVGDHRRISATALPAVA